MSSVVLTIFALIGVPLFAIFGAASLYLYAQHDMPPLAMLAEYYRLASQPVLLTIPLFTFAGYLLAESNAPTRIVNVAKSLLGWMPGGLAIVTIVSCAFFTAFTGASGVTIIALGGLLYPILIQEKYSDKFSMGLVTSCGSLGLLFAPSLPLILYGLIGKVSIDQLFIAGLIPGLLIMIILVQYSGHVQLIKDETDRSFKTHLKVFFKMAGYSLLLELAIGILAITCYGFYLGLFKLETAIFHSVSAVFVIVQLFTAFMFSIVILKKRWPENAILKSLYEAWWEIPLPIIILVGIYGGFITASEAAAVAAFYVLIVEVFIYKDIKIFQDVPRIAKESMMLVGGIMIILGVAMGMTNLLVDQQIPDLIFSHVEPIIQLGWLQSFVSQGTFETIQSYVPPKLMFLIILNVFLIVVGMMMDIFSAIVVVVPIITPIALKYGVDPVHLAIVFLANLEIGYITPPVGLNLFISSFRFNRPVFELYRIAVPYLILLGIALILITYFPIFSLGLLQYLGLK